MNKDSKRHLRSENIYQVFLRQHPKDGTFKSLISDLPRIKSLGMNYIYLMPIHPIGKVNRKGLIGSPYSVSDYMEINPEYGTMEDFKEFMKKAQELNLKVMLDMVFHHTSHDAVLYQKHPDWYYKENGLPTRKVYDCQDIIDLDFRNEDLHEYLIDVLLFWTGLGVAGFRFDSASLIPISFWKKAKEKVLAKHPNVLFLGESSHLKFIKEKRDEGYLVLSDGELYEVFDILYDYDVYTEYNNYLKDYSKLNIWLTAINNQESLYPKDYVKLRFLENHDINRVASYIDDENRLLNLTAMLGYLKGAMMILAGQEYKVKKRPSLFEIDRIKFLEEEKEIYDLIHKMSHIRKDELFQTGVFRVHLQDKEVAVFSYENEMSIAYGIFNLGSVQGEIDLNLKDGIYQNILYPNQVKISEGKLQLADKPMILFAMKRLI